MDTLQNQNKTKDLKFYSQKSIGIATFLGGPIAAGYLLRENYLALNKPDEAKKAFVYGLLSTVFVFGIIFIMPERIIDKVPNQIIPIIYTAIIYYIVEKTQGETLKLHKEFGNEFYSGWNAARVGFVSLLLIITIIIGFVFLFESDENLELYDAKMEVFSKNEKESIEFYNYITIEDKNKLLNRLDSEVIPKWNQNINIIKQVKLIEGLPEEAVEQNKILLRYSELRLATFKLLKKAISEDTAIYNNELDMLHSKMDQELEKLNN